MKTKVNILKNHNCFLITFGQNPTYLKVFNKNNNLIQNFLFDWDVSSFRFFCPPQNYQLETDGEIEDVGSEYFNPKTFEKISILDNPLDPPSTFLINGEIIAESGLLLDQIKKEVIDFESFREALLQFYTQQAILKRQSFISDEMIFQASLSILSEEEFVRIRSAMSQIKEEGDRINKVLRIAKNAEELLKIQAKFPDNLEIKEQIPSPKKRRKPNSNTNIQEI